MYYFHNINVEIAFVKHYIQIQHKIVHPSPIT